MLRDRLRLDGIDVGRKRISTLMKTEGSEALYRNLVTPHAWSAVQRSRSVSRRSPAASSVAWRLAKWKRT